MFRTAVLLLIAAAACSSSADEAQQPKPEFLVFMAPKAAPGETAAVHRFLRASPRIERVRFISHDAAFAQFRRYEGKDRPELVNTITAADLPESFDVFPRSQRDIAPLVRRLRRLPGLDQVQVRKSLTERERRRLCRIADRFPHPPSAWHLCRGAPTR